MTATASAATHPRISERRAAVEGESLRARNRKLIAAGVVVLVGLLAAASTQSPLLDVDEIRVVGASHTSSATIRETALVELGAPLVGLDHEEIERRLLALPAVAGASATNDWRGVLTIEIVERAPVARFASVEAAIVVAADGTVLDVTKEPDERLPLVTGAMFSSRPGENVPEVVVDALAVASALPSDIGAVTNQVELSIDSLALQLVGGGQVILGDARDLALKFDAVRAFLAQVELDCLGAINVQAPMVPVLERRADCA